MIFYIEFVYLNTGPGAATGVHLTQALPDGTGFNSVDSTQGACTLSDSSLDCDLGTLPANASATISVYLSAATEGTLSTLVGVTRQEPDADSSNNSASLLTEVIPLRLLSVVGTIVNEDASVATFEIALDDVLDVPVSFSFATSDGSARGGSDYIRTNGAAVIAPGAIHTFVSVAIVDDQLNEPAEAFALGIFSVTNAFAGDSSALASIMDNDPEPLLLAFDALTRVAVSGSTNVDFKFSLSRPSGYAVSVDFATADGTARSGSDYAPTNGTLTIPVGTTNATLRIPIFSSFPDPTNRFFNLQLSNPSHAGLVRSAAVGTIVGRNSRPMLNVSDASVNEGASGTVNAAFKVTLSFASTTNVTVEYATQGGSATPGVDFISSSGLLTFAPGEALKTILVPVKGDLLDEPDESFSLLLSHWTNALPGITNATGMIVNDDPHPALRIQNITVYSGPSADVDALVPVQLSAPSGRLISVDFHTRNGSAVGGIDYASTNGTLTIPPGATNAVIRLKVMRDQVEPDENFFVDLDNPSNVILDSSSATVSIIHSSDGNGVLDHFEWSSISSPQFSNYPIAVIVSAKDANGQNIASFSGPIDLGAQIVQPPVEATHGTTPSTTPLGTFYQDARSQVVYLASELGGPLQVSALSLDIITPPAQTLSNWTIRMKQTTESTSSLWQTDGWQIVFQDDVTISADGWVTFPFENSFAYDGIKNLLIDFSFNNNSSSFDGQCRAFESLQPRTLVFRSDSSNGNPLSWSGVVPQGFTSTLVPNLRLLPAPVSLPISPVLATQWTNGIWSGSVVIPAVGTNVQLVAKDDDSHLGWSNPFALRVPGDVEVTMNASPVPADLNSVLTWSFTVHNYGPGPRTGVVLSNLLDSATGFLGATSSQGACTWNGQTLRCDLGTLPASATAAVSVQVVTPSTAATVVASAKVSQNETDPDLSNNSAVMSVPVINYPAQVVLTSPGSGAQLNAGYQILLSASASDSLGINRVEFYDGPGLLGQRFQEPYLIPWNNAAAGPHLLKAVAYDNSGQASTSTPVSIVVRGSNHMIYTPPPGNWSYLYGGDAALGGGKGAAVLDGTWDHNNASSEWDGLGRGPGTGSLGGISTDGTALTLEDAVSSNAGTANNRSLYFTRALSDPGVTNPGRMLDDGLTLTFRARLTPSNINPAADMILPNGFGIFKGGKGNFGFRQAGQPGIAAPGLISFSLVQNVEDSSTSNSTIFPSSGLVMNRLNGDLPTNAVDTASRAELTPLWSLAPGSRPYLNNSTTERSIAYNLLTAHLLLVSRAPAVGGLQIPVLSATTGAEVGKLATNGIAGGSGVLNCIGVAADGAIYAANVVAANNSSTAAFRIYRWAYESAMPSVAYSGEVLNGQRWGDTLDVRGSGLDTQIIAGSGPGTNKVVVFTTSNGLTFTPTLLNSVGVVSNGDFRTSIAFGPGNTFFGKQLNGNLLQMSFNLATQTASVLRSFDSTALPVSMAGFGVESNLRLLAGLSPSVAINGIPTLRLYDLDALSPSIANQPMDTENFAVTNVNTGGISGVVFGDNRVFALDANNGLLACDLSMLSGTGNLLPLDPTVFHEFWINIQRNQSPAGNGTHTVSVYTDGAMVPTVFHVTAGSGSDVSATSSASTNFTTSLATSYLALGCPGALETGSIDVDFFGYKPGLFAPATNSPPVLAPIADRTIHAGMTLLVTNQVFDSDSSPGTLTFSLDSGPPGALVGGGSGVFSWTAPDSQIPGTNLVTIRVTDSSPFPLSDTKSFRVIVLGRPRVGAATVSGGSVQLAWSAIPGQRYRVQFKNNLNDAVWQTLSGDILGSGPAAAKTDTSASGSQRFYRIMTVP
jgi:uncharacterized repeat protein (TIGR01451 family)